MTSLGESMPEGPDEDVKELGDEATTPPGSKLPGPEDGRGDDEDEAGHNG